MLSLKCFAVPSVMKVPSEAVQMCPRYPEPVPLDHPIPVLKDALEKVCEEKGAEGGGSHHCLPEGVKGTMCFVCSFPQSISGERVWESRRWRIQEQI